MQSFTSHLMFQIVPLIGEEAKWLHDYLQSLNSTGVHGNTSIHYSTVIEVSVGDTTTSVPPYVDI